MRLSSLMPAVLVFVAVITCALPWGGPPELRWALPLLPYVVIHRCVERWGDSTPDWLVFLAGFATDVVGQGPLGYWSLIYLCGFTMIRSMTVDRKPRLVSSILMFSMTVACLASMQWSVASIYYLRPVDPMPLVFAMAIAVGFYFLVMLLIPASAPVPVRINGRLERGL